jgi:hypothetical protein
MLGRCFELRVVCLRLCLCLPKHCLEPPASPAAARRPWWGYLRSNCGPGFGDSLVLAAASCSHGQQRSRSHALQKYCIPVLSRAAHCRNGEDCQRAERGAVVEI